MVEELSFIRMEIDMMGTGLMACHRVKVEWFMQMKIYMKDNGMKVKEMGMVCWLKETEIISKDIGSTIWEKDKAVTIIMIKISCLLENGWMINLKQGFILRLKMMKLRNIIKNHISLIHMYCHQYLNWNWQIPRRYWRELWKELREKEQSSGLNIYLLRKCSQLLSYMIWNKHLKLRLKGKHLSIFCHWRLYLLGWGYIHRMIC
jgi:hypothetical protein